jgi:hypothetical protein
VVFSCRFVFHDGKGARLMITFVLGVALGLFIGLFLSAVRAIKHGTINAQVGIEDEIAVGISIDWPEILAVAAVGLIVFLIYRQM